MANNKRERGVGSPGTGDRGDLNTGNQTSGGRTGLEDSSRGQHSKKGRDLAGSSEERGGGASRGSDVPPPDGVASESSRSQERLHGSLSGNWTGPEED